MPACEVSFLFTQKYVVGFNAISRAAKIGQFSRGIGNRRVKGAQRAGGVAESIQPKTVDAKAAGIVPGRVDLLDGGNVGFAFVQAVAGIGQMPQALSSAGTGGLPFPGSRPA